MIGLLVPVLAGGAKGIVTLSGESSLPNELSQIAGMGNTNTWGFRSDGTVDGDGAPFQAGTEWNSFQPNIHRPFWLFASVFSGDAPSGDLNSWVQLSGSGSSDRVYVWASDGSASSGILQVQIALSSTGDGVVAEGFYSSVFT